MRANIWIRAEDEKKWSQIKNKSEFIHLALNPEFNIQKETAVIDGQKVEYANISQHKPTITNEDWRPSLPDPETGYPCCEKKRPCKHWQFNSNTGKWVNELTGKEREPEV